MFKVPFGIAEGVLLFALGFGYIICILSKKEDKELKQLGHVIGMCIIVLSSVFILLSLFVRCKNYCYSNSLLGCPVMMKITQQAPVQK